MPKSATANIPVKKVNLVGASEVSDTLATEEPLEIRLIYGSGSNRVEKNISITMRTPGNDRELAVGFLFTEGIIHSSSEVVGAEHLPGSDGNVIRVELSETANPDTSKLERHFYTTSSCGVCGKASIDAVKIVCNIKTSDTKTFFLSELIYKLPDILRKQQEVFETTGGLHASALFDTEGHLLLTREDVGRHNALDKLIGVSLEQNMLPLDKYLLMLSGRASFELIQKAMMAGIQVVAAVGAPSSLAVEMAKEAGMTLIGFLRGERFNIYSGAERVII
jgi:FdhD protein